MFAPLVDFFTGRSSAWKAKYEAAFVTLVDPDTGEPYVAGGGGGGGGLADLLYTDDTGTVFVYRDTGTGTMVARTIPGNVAYTVGANPRPYVSPTAATSTLQTAGNTSLSNLDTDLGAQADAAASSDTGTFSVIAFIKRGMQNWTSLFGLLPSALTAGGSFKTAVVEALPAGTNAIGTIIGQRPFAAAVTITRPANTTAYAVNQVLSTATTGLTAFPTFALGIGNSQRASINNITLISSNGTAATKGQFAIHLFNSASPSGGGFNDAAAFAPTAAALGATTNELVGVVPSLVPMGTAAYGYVLTNDTRQVETDGSGNVYLAIVLQNAYTPASGETIRVIVSGTF
jgi:hypothetical protein